MSTGKKISLANKKKFCCDEITYLNMYYNEIVSIVQSSNVHSISESTNKVFIDLDQLDTATINRLYKYMFDKISILKS